MFKMKRQEKIKLMIVALLTVLLIILFYFYVSPGDDSSSVNNSGKKFTQFSKDKLSKDIDSIIFTFGIRKDWIKDISLKDKEAKNKNEQPFISIEVLVPLDLPFIGLNYEITNYLRNNNYDARVTEDPKTKNIFMNVYFIPDSSKKQTGILKFSYTDSVKRNAAEVCIVLDSLDSYSLTDVEKILGTIQEFSVFLPLRNDKADYQSMITDMNIDYLLKFSLGNGDDITADFKDDMKESFWKSKVKSVYLTFPRAAGIVLYDKEASPDFIYEVRSEFMNNYFNVYNDSLFIRYKRGENKISSLFTDITTKSGSGKKFLFYAVNFSPAEFSEYDKEVYKLKKLGYRFFDFREMMKRVNNTDR